MRRRALLLLVLSTAGCTTEEERAPTLSPSGGVTNPYSCTELREKKPAPNEGGQFWFPGGLAQCMSEGQWCPVEWVEDRCDAGAPYARCVGGAWVLSCEAIPEAGVLDGAGDA